MPKRSDIKTILIIGAGPIVIGQACEFDYSGAQACKALREEGYRVILVNSNPATIMTDPATADVTYIEPITWQTVEKIIAKERPDAILPTMGGQTALNCALDLWHQGVLHKYKGAATNKAIELIGATPESIDKAEDRLKFKDAMTRICLGHQIMALASGAKTFKMKFGHHGANHPVKDLDSGRVSITSQNHGFAVDEKTLPANLRPTHVSLFDGTLQGLARTDRPAFCFQGHPEASPGPHDIGYLFDRFTGLMDQAAADKKK